MQKLHAMNCVLLALKNEMVFIALFIRMNFGDHVSDHDAVMTPGLGSCHRHWQWFNVQHGFQMPGTLATHLSPVRNFSESLSSYLIMIKIDLK
jgi:hypothetical protein